MLLADFRASNKSKFEKLSAILKQAHGVSIVENASQENLIALKKLLERKISAHKLNGDTLDASTDLVENILMLECVGTLLQEFVMTSGEFVVTEEYVDLVNEMSHFIENSVRLGDSFDVAVESAMRMYQSSKFRYPEGVVKTAASTAATEALGGQSMMEPDMMGSDMMEPNMAEPDMMGVDMAEPNMAEPDMMEPDMMGVDMAEPDMAEPDVMGVDMAEPDMAEPEMMDPDMMEPDMMADAPDADMEYDTTTGGEYPMIENIWSEFIK